MKRYDASVIDACRSLLAQGATKREIARRLGMTVSAIGYYASGGRTRGGRQPQRDPIGLLRECIAACRRSDIDIRKLLDVVEAGQ